MSDNRKTGKPERGADKPLSVSPDPSTPEPRRAPRASARPNPFDSPSAALMSSSATSTPGTRRAPRAPNHPSPFDSPGSISRGRSSRPPMASMNQTRNLEAMNAERATAERAAFVDELLRGIERRSTELSAREIRVARERHVVGGQYDTALEMNRATLLEIDDVQQREDAVEARENALEDRELMIYYRELWFQKRELALKQKLASKKASPFSSLHVRPSAASRASENLTVSDRAYDGDIDTLTQSNDNTGSASVNRAGQYAAGSSSSLRGDAASSSAFARHFGSMSLDSFFNLHYRDGAGPLWIQQSDPFYTLPTTTYESPARGRAVISPRHDQEQALSATAAVFTPRAAQAGFHDAGVPSLEHAPVSSPGMSSPTPAPAGIVREADEMAAETEGASLYEDAQENVVAEEEATTRVRSRSRSIRRISGVDDLRGKGKGKGKEKCLD